MAGLGGGHLQGAAVAWYRGSFSQAPSFGSVGEAGQRGLLDAAAAGQVGHPSRALGQDAQQPGNGGPVGRWMASHQPDPPQGKVPGRKVAVTAEQLHGPERGEAWRQITAAAPRFAACQGRPTANCRSSAWSPVSAERLAYSAHAAPLR